MITRLAFLLAKSEWEERRARTLLTMSGIIIAVLSIMLILILTQSFQDAFTRQISTFNSNWIYITTEDKTNGPPFGLSILTRDDVTRVKHMHGVTSAWPVVLLTTMIGEESVTLRILPAEHVKDRYDHAAEGRLLTKRDAERKVVLIGSLLADRLNLHVGETIRLFNTSWRIIGIIPEQGDFREDMSIIIPYEAWRKLTGEEHVSLIIAESPTPSETARLIERKLDRNPGNTATLTREEALQRVEKILGILNLTLLVIISISLIVGSMGIASSMTSSILQRKRLIGTLRALGMQRWQIILILLLESSLLTLTATLIGILLSIPTGSMLISIIARHVTLPLGMSLTPSLLTTILILTLTISLLASIIPAWQASKIPPAEAVRYE